MTDFKIGKGGKVSRFIYLLLSVLFATGVIMQVVLAGMAIFVNGIHWNQHSNLVHIFGFNIPILMLITALLGKMPRWAYWHVFGMLVLLFIMYFTANFTAISPMVAAFHPVIAMILFMFSIWIVYKAWKINFTKGV